ncbi:hypothetical protein AGMMS49938_14380 [Fibrobacterales bacterium]|nr:hypothetical protein AGMMS49938_14380 [Fibrobacterales bacterium]
MQITVEKNDNLITYKCSNKNGNLLEYEVEKTNERINNYFNEDYFMRVSKGTLRKIEISG